MGGSGDDPAGTGASGGSGGHKRGPRRRGRKVAAVIGPLAGAMGLALLLGVGVSALAAKIGGCSGATLDLAVAASPDIAPAVIKTATRFNDGGHKVGGKCVRATVRPAESAEVTTLLTGQGGSPGLGRPDVWIPDSARWTALVHASAPARNAVTVTGASVAQSPIVAALPQTLATRLKSRGVPAQPSWDNLLSAAGGTPGGAVTKNPVIPAGSVRLYAPDPTHTGTGMDALLITSTLLANDPDRDAIFTGIVRTVRESAQPTVQAEFATLGQGAKGRSPILLAPEQAVWKYDRNNPAERAVAVYPAEGTMPLDYPVTLTTADADKQKAARLLETALSAPQTRTDVRALGFRSADGQAPADYGTATGVSPQRPRLLPAPQDAQVVKVMQAWSRLSLGIRMLSLIDISGSMGEEVASGVTRLQVTAQASQGGVGMLADDTELGQWFFSTKVDGSRDWRETVSVGPLGERIGSATRRQLILSGLTTARPIPAGDTGLYDSVLAAYRYMVRTFKPEFGNSILLLTDGRNDDPGGPSLKETLAELRRLRDPDRPVQIVMIGFAPGVDTGELNQIADVTNGQVFVARKPQEIQKIFLEALSRRTQN